MMFPGGEGVIILDYVVQYRYIFVGDSFVVDAGNVRHLFFPLGIYFVY